MGYLGTARFVELLMFTHLLSFLGIEEEVVLIIDEEIRPLFDLCIHFERFNPGPFN